MRMFHRGLAALLAALGLTAGLTGCSGISLLDGISPRTEGEIGDTLSNMFFDCTVNSAESTDSYFGYPAADGEQLVVCNLTLKNTTEADLPMYDADFQLQWGDGEEDYAWSLNPLEEDGNGMPTNDQMPLQWTLPVDGEATYDLVFEVPADVTTFSLVYLELYTDENGNEGEGDLYTVTFDLGAQAYPDTADGAEA